jgi:hypothetical protein
MTPTRSFVPTSDRAIVLALSDEIRRELPETRPGGVAPRERLVATVLKKGDDDVR